MKSKDSLDESMRRLGGILASPSLVTSYEHTTPLLERAWLRRAGLTREETKTFLSLLCQKGLLDIGAKAVVLDVCRRQHLEPKTALRRLLEGQDWPEEEG
jgi:hypothetical protein